MKDNNELLRQVLAIVLLVGGVNLMTQPGEVLSSIGAAMLGAFVMVVRSR